MASWPGPRVIAHRGGGRLAPENTLAALRKGAALGARGVEFDVMLAADGVAVLMHDPEFGRTVPGPGAVALTSAARLRALDAGSWYAPEYAGEPVPLFAEVVRYCVAQGMWMNAEIKPAPGFEVATGEAAGRVCLAAGVTARAVLFSSFSRVAVAAVGRVAPGLPRALLMGRIASDWRDALADLGCVALHCDHRNLDAGTAGAVKAAGYGLMCYTVDTVERARELFDWGVDAVCTDRPDLLHGLERG